MQNKGFYSLLLCFLIALSAIAQEKQTINIALITDKASGLDKSPLVSLLEVELSQKEGIKLLERAAIDKILEEQKLSAAGLLDRNAAIKIGKLLRTDAFIILSREKPVQEDSRVSQAEGTDELIRVRVAETAHGLRLLDYFEQSDSANPKEAVERIIKKLESILKKIYQPDEKLIPIGIVDIHRVQLGEQYKMLERTLPVMLSVRLSLEPQVIMLEREDLKVLLDEKLRTEGEDSKFWNSAVLVEGYLQPNSGRLEMHLSLKQAAGAELKSLTILVEPNEPVAAIAKASTEIIQQLQNSPPTTKWNLEQEADQFYNQGQMLHKNKRYKEAFSSLETAYAIRPENTLYTGALFINEWYARFVRNSPFKYEETGFSHYSDIELAEIVLNLVRQIQKGYENKSLKITDIISTWGEPLGLDYKQISYFCSSISVSNAQVRATSSVSREIWTKTIRSIIKGSPDPTKQIELAWASSDKPEEVINNLKELFAEYEGWQGDGAKQRYERFYPYWRSWILPWYNNRHTKLLFPRNPSDAGLEKTQLKDSTKEFMQLWLKYLEENSENKNPLAKFLSCMALCEIFTQEKFTDVQKSEYFRHKAIESVINEIVNSNSFSDLTKNNVIYDIKDKVFANLMEFEELLDSLIAAKDINCILLLEPGTPPIARESMSSGTIYIPNIYLEQLKEYCIFSNKLIVFFQSYQDNPRVSRELVNISNFRSNLQKRFPELKTAYNINEISVTMLLKKEDWPDQVRFPVDWPDKVRFPGLNQQYKLEKNMLWFSSFYKSVKKIDPNGNKTGKFDIVIAGMDLEKKTLISIWRTAITSSFSDLIQLNGMEIIDKNIYLPVAGLGLIEIPINVTKESGKSQIILTQKNGLPSIFLTSIAKVENKLLIAYEDNGQESGLGFYDPKTEQWETIFCSTLKGKPPFYSDRPYTIYSLMPVSSDKLFFLVLDQGEYWKTSQIRNCDGLWQIDTNTGQTKYFGPVWIYTFVFPNTEVFPGKIFFKTAYTFIEFDIYEEKMKFLLGYPKILLEQRSQKKDPVCELENELFIPDALENQKYFNTDYFETLTASIHNDKMWARLGRSEIAVLSKNKPWKEAEIIENNILDGEAVYKFVSTPYGLVGIGEGIVGLIETGD